MTGAHLITWIFLGLAAVLAVLGVALLIAFLRLGSELKKTGEKAESLTLKLQRTVRIVQLATPVVALLRSRSHALKGMFRKNQEAKKHGKK